MSQIIDSPADDKMFLVLELIQGGQVMHWDDKAFRYRAANTPNEVIPKEDARNCMRDVVMALSYCKWLVVPRMHRNCFSERSELLHVYRHLPLSASPPYLPSRHQT